MEATVTDATTSVTIDERVVAVLRALPVERLRELMKAIDDLVGSPACPEAQADGVPCPSAANDCARCLRARTAFETLQLRLGLQ
jgi:hypothetical protein